VQALVKVYYVTTEMNEHSSLSASTRALIKGRHFMKLPQMIVTVVAGIAFGYLGSQYLNKNIIYAIGGGMAGFGAVAYLASSKSQEKPIPTRTNQSV
jgi:hypothetical protein